MRRHRAPDANIATLAEAAALALQAAPILLLLDNCEYASPKTLGSIQLLLDAAAEAAVAMTPPRSDDHTRDPLARLRRRAARVELQPLSRETASALIRQIAPTIDPASEQTIIQRSAGHAQTVAAYAERVEAHGDDERHSLESYRTPRRWLVVLIMLVAFIAIIYAQRDRVENDLVAAIGTGIIAVTLWLLRPRFMKLIGPKRSPPPCCSTSPRCFASASAPRRRRALRRAPRAVPCPTCGARRVPRWGRRGQCLSARVSSRGAVLGLRTVVVQT